MVLCPQNLSNFREFLLVKLINGEKATFQTPTFSKKRERTLEMLIKDLCDDYMQDSKTVLIGSSRLHVAKALNETSLDSIPDHAEPTRLL